ncbi:RNA-directed DNA polymerase, eukaryota, partial [Tanacetum coccineum]
VVEGLWTPNDVRIMWIVVYAPHNLSCKIALWSSLANLIANWCGGLMIMGDFNEVREAGERFGLDFNRSRMSKIDKFMISESFREVFPNVTGVVLEKEMEGFRELVADTWNNDCIDEVNGLISDCANMDAIRLRWGSKDSLSVCWMSSLG